MSMLLVDLLRNHYFLRNRRVRSDKTKRHYLLTVSQFSLMLGAPARLDNLNEIDVERFIVWCDVERSLAPHTVKQRRNYIVSLWNWCAKQRLVEKFPTVAGVDVPESIPDSWTVDELKALMRHLGRQTGYVGGVRACDWWQSIHIFWFFEGERLGATLAAEWANYSEGVLVIPAKDRKGRRKPGVYPVHPEVAAWLERIREPARERIWPWPWSEARFYQKYKAIIQGAGLVWRKRTGPQKLRRSHATFVAATGGNPTASLMHSNPEITRRYYVDTRIAKPEPQNRKLPRVG